MVKRYGIGTVLSLSATVLIWSTTFAALVAALRYFSPGNLLFLRWTLTAGLFLAYAVATRMRVPERKDVPAFLLAGLLGFGVYQTLLVFGQQGVTASMAGFLINMNPVFTTLIAVALRRETANGFTWVGLTVCMAGLAVMAEARGGLGAIGPSALLVVLAALCFALYTIITKPLFTRYTPMEVTTYAIVGGSVPFLVFAPGALHAVASASPVQLSTLVFLALFPGGISYVLWSRSCSALSPGVASRFLYLVPVLGVPIAWLWVGEAPQLLTVAGGAVTLAGIALASMRRLPWTGRVPEIISPGSSSAGAISAEPAIQVAAPEAA